MQTRPSSLLKFFFRFPLIFHRIGLGGWERLAGLEWMALTTTGRKTGKKRYHMVDVLKYNPQLDTYYIEAAYGKKADWYLNIMANPIFQAQVARRKFSAVCEAVSPAQAGQVIIDFYRARPIYARVVMKSVGVTITSEGEMAEAAQNWTLLAVHPIK